MLDGQGFDFPNPSYDAGNNPLSVAVADFDGDGHVDLVAANSVFSNGTVSVLRNQRDGTFAPRAIYAVGSSPSSVIAADFDGDGHVDIVTANRTFNGNVSVLRNLGNGTFAPHVTYAVGNDPQSVSTADIDDDGYLDLVVANTGNTTVSVLRNQGNGTFASQAIYAVGSSPRSITTGDVDGDGLVDIVVANSGSNTVSMLRNQGNGTFAAQVTYAVGNNPQSVATTDLDGDEDVDLVIANTSSSTVSILRNQGDGTFAAHVTYATGSAPNSVDVADINGDGHLDVVAASGATISVLRNEGDGTFAPRSDYPLALRSVKAVDVDGDGHVDLAAIGAGGVLVLRNLGNGTFDRHVSYAVGRDPYAVDSADFDGDGDIDLVVANSEANTLSVLLNLGNGTFAPQVEYGGVDRPRSVTVADVNGDGHLDLVAPTYGTPGWVSVLRNLGNGTFAPRVTYPVGSSPQSVTAADFDGDGHVDLVTANSSGNNISVLLNQGDGTFAPQVTYAVGNLPYSVTSVDVDRDGRADLVIANFFSNTVSVLRNQGDGTFAPQVAYAVGNTPYAVKSADVDGDGHVDLITANSSNSVSVLRNQGDGTFAPQVTFAVGGSPQSVTVADFDGDGRVDLATANYTSRTVSVLRNLGNSTFAPPASYASGVFGSRSITAADFDGDGRVDLVTANSDAAVSMLRNLPPRNSGGILTDLVAYISAQPGPVQLGQTLVMGYEVRNIGAEAAQGQWSDSIYLSRDDKFDTSDVLLARFLHEGGLAPATGYTRTLELSVPFFAGFVPGEWHLLVRTDAGNRVPETDDTNNLGISAPFSIEQQVTKLVLGHPITGEIAAGESLYFQVEYAAGDPLAFQLTGLAADGTVELYVKRDGLPSRTVFDRGSANPFTTEQYIYLPTQAQAGTFSILVHAPALASSPASFELTASTPDFGVLTKFFGTVGNAGDYTLRAVGAGFDRTVTAQLVDGQGFELAAKSSHVDDATRFYATFDLRGVTPGTYSVLFTNASEVQFTVLQSLTVVVTADADAVIPRVIVPSAIRRGVPYSFTVEWENNSLNDAYAPLLTVGNSAPFGLSSSDYNSLGTRYTFLGISTLGGPLGILRPGQRESLTFWSYSNSEPGDYTVFVNREIKDAAAAFDWDSLRPSLIPAGMNDIEFEPIFQQLISQVGPTAGDYLAMLSRNAALVVGPSDAVRNPLQSLRVELAAAWTSIAPSISGILTGESASELAGRVVLAENLSTYELFFGSILANGAFRIVSLPQGEYQLSVPTFEITSLGDGHIVVDGPEAVVLAIEPAASSVYQQLIGEGVEEKIAAAVASGDIFNPAFSPPAGSSALPNKPILAALAPPVADPISTAYYSAVLAAVRIAFKNFGYTYGLIHLNHFLSGMGGDLNYPDGSFVSGLAKNDANAYFSHRRAAQLVEASVRSLIETKIRAGEQVPSTLTMQELGLRRVPGPSFYWAKGSQAVESDLIAAFGDMGADHFVEVTSTSTSESNGTTSYSATIRYLWKDRYTFDKADANTSIFDKAARYMEVVAGSAKGFNTSIEIIETITGSVKDDDDKDDKNDIRRPTSFDPNDITGPAGVGPANHIVAGSLMPYTIRFENDAEQATAPAAMVTITQLLDADLDWTTFRLGDLGFGSVVIDVPEDSAFFATRYDATATLGVFVDIEAGINAATGEVRWQFVAVDPETGDLPEDPFVGFLPPNVDSPEGEGFVTYAIRPKSGATTGTVIDAEARIVFDVNDPIDTPPIFHTLDAGPPLSSINPLPSHYAGRVIPVSWSGEDDQGGSGIAAFDVFVSTDGGQFQLWLANVTEHSQFFTGDYGHSYAFYSVARDWVGHKEKAPLSADAVTAFVEPARVIDLRVRSSVWSDNSGAGYSIPVGSLDQLKPLGWYNLDQVQIVFSQDVVVDATDLRVTGLDIAEYAINSFSYDPATFTGTWTLAQTIGADRLVLTLDVNSEFGVTDTSSGHPIDGNWVDGVSSYASGDDQEGGDFVFAFNVLPGDANQNGKVDGEDYSIWAEHFLLVGQELLSSGDFTGDGTVDGADYTVWADNYLRALPDPPVISESEAVSHPLLAQFVGPAAIAIEELVAEPFDLALPVAATDDVFKSPNRGALSRKIGHIEDLDTTAPAGDDWMDVLVAATHHDRATRSAENDDLRLLSFAWSRYQTATVEVLSEEDLGLASGTAARTERALRSRRI